MEAGDQIGHNGSWGPLWVPWTTTTDGKHKGSWGPQGSPGITKGTRDHWASLEITIGRGDPYWAWESQLGLGTTRGLVTTK